MDVRYVAAVETSESSDVARSVPLVDVDQDAYHQPSGFSNVTLVILLHHENARQLIAVTFAGMVIAVISLR